MKILITLFVLFLFPTTLKAEAYNDVDEFYNQCKPLIDVIYSDTLSLGDIDNMDSQTNLMSGVCLGYFLGLIEGMQIGWQSKANGDSFCENKYNALELVKIFAEDIEVSSNKRREKLTSYIYDLLLNKICN